MSLYAKCHYIPSTNIVASCIHVCMDTEILCMFYMRDVTYHTCTSMHIYNVILPAHMRLYCIIVYAGVLLHGMFFTGACLICYLPFVT